MMRFPIIILITLFSTFSGFTQIINHDSIPFYFPEYSFNLNKSYDNIGNRYWSSFLFGLKKKILYNDKSIQECYRLLHYGAKSSVIEIFKRKDKYIVISDSYLDPYKVNRTIDSLSSEEFLLKLPGLKNIDQYFYKLKNTSFHSDKEIMIEDDRDNWVLEIRKGNKYNVIHGIELKEEIKDIIVQMMKIAKINGFRIWTSQDKYEDF